MRGCGSPRHPPWRRLFCAFTRGPWPPGARTQPVARDRRTWLSPAPPRRRGSSAGSGPARNLLLSSSLWLPRKCQRRPQGCRHRSGATAANIPASRRTAPLHLATLCPATQHPCFPPHCTSASGCTAPPVSRHSAPLHPPTQHPCVTPHGTPSPASLPPASRRTVRLHPAAPHPSFPPHCIPASSPALFTPFLFPAPHLSGFLPMFGGNCGCVSGTHSSWKLDAGTWETWSSFRMDLICVSWKRTVSSGTQAWRPPPPWRGANATRKAVKRAGKTFDSFPVALNLLL